MSVIARCDALQSHLSCAFCQLPLPLCTAVLFVVSLMHAHAGIPPDLDMTWLLYVILGVAAGLKVILYLYCVALQKQSESMLALAEDHRNDIMSNVVAILTGAAASYWREGWWIDPVGGILISLYIIYSWGAICKEQVSCIAVAHQSLLPLAVSLHHQLYAWHAVLYKSIHASRTFCAPLLLQLYHVHAWCPTSAWCMHSLLYHVNSSPFCEMSHLFTEVNVVIAQCDPVPACHLSLLSLLAG